MLSFWLSDLRRELFSSLPVVLCFFCVFKNMEKNFLHLFSSAKSPLRSKLCCLLSDSRFFFIFLLSTHLFTHQHRVSNSTLLRISSSFQQFSLIKVSFLFLFDENDDERNVKGTKQKKNLLEEFSHAFFVILESN